MILKTNAFEHGGEIPSRHTCDGENVNPALVFADIPQDAKTLALIVDDPDSFAGVWTHWLIWNISAGTKEIAESIVPPGALQGKTSFGSVGYSGPCPKKGNHRYFFKLYALDIALLLPPSSSKEALIEAMRGRIIADAEMYGIYKGSSGLCPEEFNRNSLRSYSRAAEPRGSNPYFVFARTLCPHAVMRSSLDEIKEKSRATDGPALP